MKLPAALQTDDDNAALALLQRYYGATLDGHSGFTGSAFDTWDPSGTRAASADVFTSDDVTAASLLSVQVRGRAAHELLVRRAAEFSDLLVEVGPDRDLVDVDEEILSPWPGSRLLAALKELPGVGTTTASKLMARKRPRLRPVWDTVVADHLGVRSSYIEPLRVALRADDLALHRRLVRLGERAAPDGVSALRVFDVVTWLEAKDAGRTTTGPDEVDAA
ncbi:DUF6308 family protein [uncultured Pseudokineococcus sp.]|uniref:DUF6308 family protein n=1 Tax=uncultured Pseudokineococcus sp. TaxID=1642928 RepID=UPI002611E824|nr:DUF6308 family protein [uncultured Pseudokineococcus sp.]